MNAKIPLPVDRRGIPRLTQNLGQENFPFVHASCKVGFHASNGCRQNWQSQFVAEQLN